MMPAVSELTVSPRRGGKPRPHGVLACIRFDEVLVLQGTPVMGALFSMGALTWATTLNIAILAAGSFCLVAHVFVLNDWCAIHTDMRDPNRADWVFTARGIRDRAAAYLCALLLGVSLLLLATQGAAPLWIATSLAVLSTVYSGPWVAIKGVPLASSVLHFAAGVLHFLLGYSISHAVDLRGVAIGAFFALTFCAGHLTHEARDFRSDLLNGIRTNAVRFGPERTLAAGFLLFTAADALLAILASLRLVPSALVVVVAMYPVHLWWTMQTFRAGATFENIRRLQVRYRVFYAMLGGIMAVALMSVAIFGR